MPNTVQKTRVSFRLDSRTLAFGISAFLAACSVTEGPNALPELTPDESSSPDTPTSPSVTALDAGASPTPAELLASPTAAQANTPTRTPRPAPSIPNADDYDWVLVAQGFTQPLLLSNAGDGSDRLFVVGQQGVIWVIADGEVLPQFFLDIRGRVGSEANEQGLLGLAFHPNYNQNGFFYVNYTNLSGDTIVSRFQVSADANQADADSERIVLSVDQPYSNHNGGHIEFGPDGYLYIGLGDGGSGGDPLGNGQSVSTLLGAMLRVDVDNGEPYAIPADNPFANGGGRPEIWAYGLRNPWRFSFDSLTGDLYIADVGQDIWEEINFLPGGIAGGANFGWNYFEGFHPYQGSPPSSLTLLPPIDEYNHSNGRCSVTGGVVYRGTDLPAWQGVYLFGDFCSGEVFGLAQGNDGQWQRETLYNLSILITSFGTDEEGEVYMLDRGGDLYALRPN